MNTQGEAGTRKTFTEEIEIAGGQLIDWVKHLLKDGNVRQIRVKAPGGDIMLEAPLTVGVLGGGAVALAAPWLAILGALAALVARVKVEITREGEMPSAAEKPARAAGKPARGAGKPRKAAARPARGAKKSGRGPRAGAD